MKKSLYPRPASNYVKESRPVSSMCQNASTEFSLKTKSRKSPQKSINREYNTSFQSVDNSRFIDQTFVPSTPKIRVKKSKKRKNIYSSIERPYYEKIYNE